MPVDLRVLAAASRSRRWTHAAAVILLLALAGNIAFALLTTDRDAWSTVRHASPAYLILAVLLALVPFFTNALRLHTWARFMGGTVRYRDAFRIAVASDLGSSIAPSAAGSGAVRLTMLRQHGLSTGRSTAIIAMTVFEDAIFFAVFLPLGYAVSSRALVSVMPGALVRVMERAGVVLAGAVLVGIVVSVIGGRLAGGKGRVPGSRLGSLLERLRGWVLDARGALGEVLRSGKLRAVCTLSLATIQWLCRYSAAAAIFAAFGLPAFPLTHVVLQWVVFTAGTFVPTPGGAGAVEAAFALVYHPLVPDALLGPVTATWRFLLFYLIVGFDVAYLAFVAFSRRPTSATAENEVSSSPAM
jgi:uncharacterized protein (TIRG00374 family)